MWPFFMHLSHGRVNVTPGLTAAATAQAARANLDILGRLHSVEDHLIRGIVLVGGWALGRRKGETDGIAEHKNRTLAQAMGLRQADITLNHSLSQCVMALSTTAVH